MSKKKLMITVFLLVFIVGDIVIILTLGTIWKNGAPMVGEPGFMNRITTYLTTNVAQTSLSPTFPELKAPLLQGEPDEIFDCLEDCIATLGWQVQTSNRETNTIEAVVTTPLMGFQDDIVITIQEEGENRWLSVLSSSRVGRGDLGANAGHILDLLSQLKQTCSQHIQSNP